MIMNLRFILSILALILSVAALKAQTITGSVSAINSDAKKESLVGVSVYLSGTDKGTFTESDGTFSLSGVNNTSGYIVASFTGYISDSIRVSDIKDNKVDFTLKEGIELAAAEVTVNQRGTVLSRLTAQKTELITTTGLMKMACCNLSESFENSASITVGFTDAVSGAKQVQLLGLSGIYSQMTDENVPMLRGLASTYGWSYIPGPWLESVQVSKGASSVVNGYESLTGQINVEHKKPNQTEQLFINLFADDAQRFEANVTTATQLSKKWWVGLLAHGSMEKKGHDGNDDTFLDMPKTELANFYNRWFYLDEENGVQSRFGLKFLYETREGGQDADHIKHMTEGMRLYQTNIRNKNFNVYNKTGIAIGNKEGQSIGLINSYTHHDQNSSFGDKSYNGKQNSFHSNALFTSDFGSPAHKYTAGMSFTYDDYKTNYEDRLPFNNTPLTQINRREAVVGAFGEYTFAPNDKLTFIVGMRADYNSKFGWLYTPRTNLRYSITDDIIFRVSAGRGYRSPNVIAENIGLLASSRNVNVESINNLDIEDAWNYGANITFYIPIWNGEKATLSVDYFRSDFRNQAITDIERNKGQVYFYNLEGSSHANAFQVDLSMNLFEEFDLFAAFRLNDSKVTYTDGINKYKMEKPLTSRYRGLVNLAYATKFRKWVFDVTAQFNGPSRLPGMNGYDSPKRESSSFPIYFAQITKNSKRFDVYLGVENIFDYKQKNPIIDYENPFGQNFDSSLIWGPLMGRKIYAGIRWRIGKL